MYMFNIRQTKNQGARRPRGSKSVQRSLAGRAGAAGTRVPPGAGCEKKNADPAGFSKKDANFMVLSWGRFSDWAWLFAWLSLHHRYLLAYFSDKPIWHLLQSFKNLFDYKRRNMRSNKTMFSPNMFFLFQHVTMLGLAAWIQANRTLSWFSRGMNWSYVETPFSHLLAASWSTKMSCHWQPRNLCFQAGHH